jgi:stress response protein YsnF
MIIPVLKEITVVQKKYEVVEELRITRRVTETPMVQEITLRKEHIHVERSANDAGE